MRMDPTRGPTLAERLTTLNVGQLTRILRDYGEEPDAARIARGIVAAHPQTTRALGEVVRASMSAPRLRQIGLRSTRPPAPSRPCGSSSTASSASSSSCSRTPRAPRTRRPPRRHQLPLAGGPPRQAVLRPPQRRPSPPPACRSSPPTCPAPASPSPTDYATASPPRRPSSPTTPAAAAAACGFWSASCHDRRPPHQACPFGQQPPRRRARLRARPAPRQRPPRSRSVAPAPGLAEPVHDSTHDARRGRPAAPPQRPADAAAGRPRPAHRPTGVVQVRARARVLELGAEIAGVEPGPTAACQSAPPPRGRARLSTPPRLHPLGGGQPPADGPRRPRVHPAHSPST